MFASCFLVAIPDNHCKLCNVNIKRGAADHVVAAVAELGLPVPVVVAGVVVLAQNKIIYMTI